MQFKSTALWYNPPKILAGCINEYHDGTYRIRFLGNPPHPLRDVVEQIEAEVFTNLEDARQTVTWMHGKPLTWRIS